MIKGRRRRGSDRSPKSDRCPSWKQWRSPTRAPRKRSSPRSLKAILGLLIASDRASCSPGNPTLCTGSEFVLNVRLVDEVSLEHFFRLTHRSSGTKIADADFFTGILQGIGGVRL